MHKITIYSKPDCHLCDIAKQTIDRVIGNHADVFIEIINILDNPELQVKYKDAIPVVFVDGTERFRYRVDPDQLAQIFYNELGVKLLGF